MPASPLSRRLFASAALFGALTLPASAQGVVELETIVVEGGAGEAAGSGTGPVEGYVATETTAGSKSATPLTEIPQSVSVIGREELDDRAVQKVDEALRYTPGVFTQPFGYDTDTDWIYIRGFDATQTGVYLGGLQLFQYAFGGYVIEPFLLERVEVLRGPASVLYGGSNPGGIVNLVPKRATGERIRYLEGAISDDPNGEVSFDLADRVDPEGVWSYRLLGTIKGGETHVDYADNFRGMIAPTARYQPDATTRLDLYAFYQYDDLRHTNGFFPYEGTVIDAPFGRIPRSLFYSEPELDDFDSRQAFAGYEFEKQVGEGVTLASSTRYAHVERSEFGPYTFGFTDPATGIGFLPDPVGPDTLLTRLNFAHDTAVDTVTTDNRATFEFDTGAMEHTLLTGLDYKFYRIDQQQASGTASPLDPIDPVYTNVLPPLGVPYVDEVIDMHQLGFYAQEQMRFGGGWILTLNGRYDEVWIDRDDLTAADNDYDGRDGAFSGRAGLGYQFENGLVPYVSAARFFNPQIGTTGDGAAVEPQTGEQYEAGVKYAPTFMDAIVTASVFDLTRRNVLQTDPLTFLPEPVGEVNSRGFELEAKAALTGDLMLTGAFTAYDLTIKEDVDPRLIGNRPYLLPEVLGSIWLDYSLHGALEGVTLGGGVRYVGSSFADNENTLEVPSVTLVDAAIRYEKGDWGASLNVNNLFDEKYVAGCQTALSCAYGEGRSAVLKAHVTW